MNTDVRSCKKQYRNNCEILLHMFIPVVRNKKVETRKLRRLKFVTRFFVVFILFCELLKNNISFIYCIFVLRIKHTLLEFYRNNLKSS